MRNKIFFSILLVLLSLTIVMIGSALAKSDKKDKVTICHKPLKQCQTKKVPEDAVAGHLGHGDYLGPCECQPHDPKETELPPVVTEDPNETETPPDPSETDMPPVIFDGGGSDLDIAAITRFGADTYHIGTTWLTTYWVGDAGKFRICGPDTKKHCWKLPMPTDVTAVTLSEKRGTLNLSSVKLPGTYWLYAHHWQSGNSGNDGEKLVVGK